MSTVASACPVPGVLPAVKVAVGDPPFTNCCGGLFESTPSTGLPKITAAGVGNVAKPFNAHDAPGQFGTAPPLLRPNISAVKVVDWFRLMGLGLGIFLNWSH